MGHVAAPSAGGRCAFIEAGAGQQVGGVVRASKTIAETQMQAALALGVAAPFGLGQDELRVKSVGVDQALSGHGVALLGVFAAFAQPQGRQFGGFIGVVPQDARWGTGCDAQMLHGVQSPLLLGKPASIAWPLSPHKLGPSPIGVNQRWRVSNSGWTKKGAVEGAKASRPRMASAIFSAIMMVGTFRLPLTTEGMMEASTTRRFCTP